MIALFISSDKKILEDSAVQRRMVSYGGLFEELHIIVFSRSRIPEQILAANVYLYSTASFSRWTYVWGAYRKGSELISRLRRKNSPLVISAQDPFECGVVAYWLARKWNAAWQIQIHTDLFSPFFLATDWKNRIRIKIARAIIPRADGIRVVSRRIKDSLVHYNLLASEENITVLPIWDEPIKVQESHQSSAEPYILVVSRLEAEKGVQDAIDAFLEFRLGGGRGMLHIVGDGSMKPALARRASRAGSSIVFHGWQTALTDFYSRADVLLAPSRFEGWGRAAFDAAVIGLPVIMTDTGLAAEVVIDGKNGLVVPPAEPHLMAEALSRFFGGEGLKKSLTGHPIPRIEFDDYMRSYREALEGCLRHRARK